MRLLRKLTKKEWKEIGEKYKDGGVHMYRGKRTLFYNGKELWEAGSWFRCPLIHDKEERQSWEVIIVLPGVEVIPFCTFRERMNVETVIMADTVQRIERSAFYRCRNLRYTTFSTKLEEIGYMAFYDCSSLPSIWFPPTCQWIHELAFKGCRQLLILSIPQNIMVALSSFQKTALSKENEGFDTLGKQEEAIQWIETVNNHENYALHRSCSTFTPSPEIIHLWSNSRH